MSSQWILSVILILSAVLAPAASAAAKCEGDMARAEAAIFENPTDPSSYLIKAECLNDLRHFAEAETTAWTALQFEPNRSQRARALHSAAWAMLHQNKLKQGRKYAAQAVNTAKPFRDKRLYLRALTTQGLICDKLGDRACALKSFKLAGVRDRQARESQLLVQAGKPAAPSQSVESRQLLEAVAVSPKPQISQKLLAAAAGGALVFLLLLRLLFRRGRSSNAAVPAAAAGGSGLLAGKYQLSRIIGRGDMGEVWEARDITLQRAVAIRKLAPGPAGALDMTQAQTLASLSHPNLLDIFEVHRSMAGLHIVCEFFDGRTVRQYLDEHRRMNMPDVQRILTAVCAGLELAHSKGVVHGHLKPSSISINVRGHVKVMDLGIDRRAGGSPYQAPEAGQGALSPASDVFSLGVCFYEMLTGTVPYPPLGGTSRTYVPVTKRVPGLNENIDRFIEAALVADPARRMQSIKDFREGMGGFAQTK